MPTETAATVVPFKQNTFAMPSDTLKQVWGAVLHAISDDETRHALRHVEIGAGFATATATDGHRLATATFVGLQASCDAFLVDGEKFAALVKALPKGKATCEVTVSLSPVAMLVSFAGQSFELPRCEKDWSFPEWARAVPERSEEKPDAVFGLNPVYLADACAAAESFIGRSRNTPSPVIEFRGSADKGACRIDASRSDNVARLTCVVMPVRL